MEAVVEAAVMTAVMSAAEAAVEATRIKTGILMIQNMYAAAVMAKRFFLVRYVMDYNGATLAMVTDIVMVWNVFHAMEREYAVTAEVKVK